MPTPTTAVPSPLPTSTVPATPEPTDTPSVGFQSLEPADGAVFRSGEPVSFRWNVIAGLPGAYEFAVRTKDPQQQELCRLDQESCDVTLEPGEYEWWVEVRSGDQVVFKSDPRKLTVEAEMPTLEPLATDTPDPSALQTPEPSPEG